MRLRLVFFENAHTRSTMKPITGMAAIKGIQKKFYNALSGEIQDKQVLSASILLAADMLADLGIFKDGKALTVDEVKSKPEGDFYAYTEKSAEHQTLILRPGTFLVAFPDDAHRCKGQVDGVSRVEKVVFKILIE